ncbi:hypothetical protein FHS72_000771 [Loktanella ponticola]|uniref:Plasmid recombination enzyme n=1 Tax=Yoonia ponticola TaxID=1524255 RepID=A0A7W9EX15_9RHOB|nr:plasmid recombination protein [Yoonia ponticola]MBB5721164.1 hypothetical protein [Yoonia ponticola]
MKQPEHLIVLRYERVTYHGIGGVEAHGKRLGDVDNVDLTRTYLNEFPIGHENLREIVDSHIVNMQRDNIDLRRQSLIRRRRKSELKDLEAAVEAADEAAVEAAGDDINALADLINFPWDQKNVHPFTEGFLSISHEWFLDSNGEQDPDKVDQFRSFALGYLEAEFGNEVLYARLDLDEKTPHLSFVIAPEHRERRTDRRMLSHRQHRLFGKEEVYKLFEGDCDDDVIKRKSYELLQDRVAEYAQSAGLDVTRGERRAEKERGQRMMGEAVVKRHNITPSRGREIAAALAAEADDNRTKAARHEKLAKKQLDAAETLVVKATARERAAEALEETSRQRIKSMEIGTEAILADEIAYAAPIDERGEGLKWGGNKPRDEERRNFLIDATKPARDWLIGFAKKVWQITKREKEIEKVEAEQRRKASVLVEAERKAGQRAPDVLTSIASGMTTATELTSQSFPDAWAFDAKTPKDVLDKKLNNTANLELRNAWHATSDAYLLSDDAPNLRKSVGKGLDVIEEIAKLRGFDLETGIHKPETATDPERAKQHTDELPTAKLRPRQLQRQRQRFRGD